MCKVLNAGASLTQVSQNVLQGRHLDETNLLHIQTALVTFWREPGIVYEVQEVIQYTKLSSWDIEKIWGWEGGVGGSRDGKSGIL